MEKKPIPKYPYQPFWVMQLNGELRLPNISGRAWKFLERIHSPTAGEAQDILLRLRSLLHWSRPMLAAFLGVESDTLRRWETGERKPSGAARRLIWLVEILLIHPKKLQDGMDFLFWGQREEIEDFMKKTGTDWHVPSENES